LRFGPVTRGLTLDGRYTAMLSMSRTGPTFPATSARAGNAMFSIGMSVCESRTTA